MPIYGLLLRRIAGASLAAGAMAGVLVNLVSHPIGFLVLTPALRPLVGAIPTLVIVELVAWVGEASLLRVRWQVPIPTLLAVSYVANAASFSLGLLVFR